MTPPPSLSPAHSHPLPPTLPLSSPLPPNPPSLNIYTYTPPATPRPRISASRGNFLGPSRQLDRSLFPPSLLRSPVTHHKAYEGLHPTLDIFSYLPVPWISIPPVHLSSAKPERRSAASRSPRPRYFFLLISPILPRLFFGTRIGHCHYPLYHPRHSSPLSRHPLILYTSPWTRSTKSPPLQGCYEDPHPRLTSRRQKRPPRAPSTRPELPLRGPMESYTGI